MSNSRIQAITPLTPDMQPMEAKTALVEFLHEKLHPNNRLKPGAHTGNTSSGREYIITNFEGENWVKGAGDGMGRFLGGIYLNEQLEELKPLLENKWTVAETKYALKDPEKSFITCKIVEYEGLPVIESADIVSYSLHLGNDRPLNRKHAIDKAAEEGRPIYFESQLQGCLSPEQEQSLERDKAIVKSATGYRDFEGNANLRKLKDGTIGIIDTEIGSFAGPRKESLLKSPLIGQTFTFELKDIWDLQPKLPLAQQHATNTAIPKSMEPLLDKVAQSLPHDIKEASLSIVPHSKLPATNPQHGK